MNSEIARMREEYAAHAMLEHEMHADPLRQFELWWMQAVETRIPEPNAMALATASADGMPSARVVLMKGFDQHGFSFFTNYHSYKALQLEENPRACLLFFWKELERQVRITGLVSRLPEEISDQYFASRPEGSRLGAWASPQSQVIDSRQWLEQEYARVQKEMELNTTERPPHWGGYLVKPVMLEFWQGRPSRLHDRIQYSLEASGSWKMERLAP